jgi:hypothetical protein
MPIVLLSPDSLVRLNKSDCGHWVVGPIDVAELIDPLRVILLRAVLNRSARGTAHTLR